MNMQQKMVEQVQAALVAGVPLVAINTPDPEATMVAVQQSLNGNADRDPLLQWDAGNGLKGRNENGREEVGRLLLGADLRDDDTGAPDSTATLKWNTTMRLAAGATENTVLFVVNGHLQLDEAEKIQVLSNLRDSLKKKPATCILLGVQVTLPLELRQDFVIIDEPLPEEAALTAIVETTAKAGNITLDDGTRDRSVNLIRGLPAFAAEQAVAMSRQKRTVPGQKKKEHFIDTSLLTLRTDKMINETDGLTVGKWTETFETLGGLEQAKDFHAGIINGEEPPNVIVFLDEGEKSLAGATSDWVGDGGVAKDFLGYTCSFMEDRKAQGIVYYGPGGGGKTAFAKAFANGLNVRILSLDVGSLQGGHVGESQRRVRNAYKVIDAVGGGRIMFIMTCNKVVTFPPELKRRFFTNPPFFFDLTTRRERELIWPIHLKGYGLENRVSADELEMLLDKEWTGAEIRNCCWLAWRQKRPVSDAARYIIPVSVSDAGEIDKLRHAADGKFLDATADGLYRYRALGTELKYEAPRASERRFRDEED
jgi:hypothetical protein